MTPGVNSAIRQAARLVCAVLLIAACASDNNNGGADTPTVTATATTLEPQSATPAATIVTAPSLTVAAPEATTAPPTTPNTVTDTSSAHTTATTDSTGSLITTEYTPATPPKVPSTSAPVQADNSHPDGVYYATVTEGGDPPPANGTVVFELVQLFVGPDCIAHFGAADPDSCVNDYGVETDPTSTVELPLARQVVTVADAATQLSYQVSGAELYGLIHGDDPAAGAPEGYVYSGFGYFLTIDGGTVTRLEQWWTP